MMMDDGLFDVDDYDSFITSDKDLDFLSIGIVR